MARSPWCGRGFTFAGICGCSAPTRKGGRSSEGPRSQRRRFEAPALAADKTPGKLEAGSGWYVLQRHPDNWFCLQCGVAAQPNAPVAVLWLERQAGQGCQRHVSEFWQRDIYSRRRDLGDSSCSPDAQVFGACSRIKRLLTRWFRILYVVLA